MRWPHSHGTPVPDDDTVAAIVDRNVVLAAAFDAPSRDRLLQLTMLLLGDKRWEAVGGISLDDEVRVTIAANAVIPVLALDDSLYRDVRSIIIRPTTSLSRGRRAGPAGVVSDEPMAVIGLAAANRGPLTIAWDAALRDSRHPERGRNVVIHEFAHKIDMSDGYSDGTPPLRGDAATGWAELLRDEYERAETRDSDSVLRPYAWSNSAEFFAVASEAFFCTPNRLRSAKPTLYGALQSYYRQDPAGRGDPALP